MTARAVAAEGLERRYLLSGDACGCSDSEPQLLSLGNSPDGAPAIEAPAAQVITPQASTPDASNDDPTAWLWYSGVDAAFLQERIDDGYRITDIEVDTASPALRFTAALVHNSGSYAKGWWWYFGQTVASLSDHLTANNARLVDVESYDTAAGKRLAGVMIANTGADASGWWWYVNASPAFVTDRINANNGRLIDIDEHTGGANRTFDVIMVSNTGAQQRAWWYYYNQTPAQISARMNENNARLVDLESVDGSHFDVIMEQSAVSAWWWYYGQSLQGLHDHAVQNGARLFDVERYSAGGQAVFAGIMVNNSNALTTRVGEILRDSNPSADTGLYLKRVDGPVLAALRESDRFEPASMIKALLHLHAMRQVQAGNISLAQQLFMYYDPNSPYVDMTNVGNPDTCPNNYAHTANNRVSLPLQQVLERMMERSDNRATETIDVRFGRPAINATAAAAGMVNTDFASLLGCGVPGNYLTLADTGRLYEGVLDHVLLNAANADTFFRLMTDDNDADREQVPYGEGVFGPFRDVVLEEAADLLNLATNNATVLALRDAFVNAMTGAWKGGGYTLGAPNNQWREVRTAGGYVGLPFRDDGTTNVVNYVYGIFIDNALVPQSNPTPGRNAIDAAWSDSQGELLRDEIRRALATWRPVVRQVYVSGANWADTFERQLVAEGLGGPLGFAIPGGAGQRDELPWNNLNRVSITFDQDVNVQQADLVVRGTRGGVRPFSAFAYNAPSRTATWTLAQALTADRLVLELDSGGAAGVRSALGLALDGEWNAVSDNYPSGNGTQGGDFRFHFNVLPGDVNRNGSVSPTDIGQVRAGQGTSTTNLGVAPRNYTVFRDVNANGNVSPTDFAIVRGAQGTTLEGVAQPPPAILNGASGGRGSDDEDSLRALLA